VYSTIDGDKTAKSQSFHHDYDPPPPMMPAEKEQRPRDPRYSLKFKYKYDGNTVERITYYSDGTEGTRVVSTYEGGKKIKEDLYGRDGKLSRSSVSVYGERGEELERDNYAGGTVSSRYKYTDYEIDLRGNWIRRTMWLSKGTNSEFQPYESQCRTITYFDDKAAEAMAKSTPQGGDRPLVRVNTGTLADRAIKKIDPILPPEAKEVRGEVLIEVSVDEQGNVASVEGVTGDRALVEAAIAAVRQWKFNPTKLSGKPVRVIGRLRFKFD
jgi:protein TonB